MVEFVYDNEGNSAFWDDGDAFNKYMSETLGDTVEGGLDVANESWFKHDTGGTITAVDDLEDWVRRNLDLSLAPNCKIIDIYNDDMPSIFVGIQGPENEIEEIKNWQPSIWEFKLNPNYVNKIGSSTYELVFGLPDYIDVNPDGFGRNDNEPSLEENKEPAENKLEENKIKESAARVQCADELKALVSRFVAGLTSIDLKGETYEEKFGHRVNDMAELMIKEAKWVGFPLEALKYLPWIVNPNCLFLGPIDIGDLCNTIEGKLHEMNENKEPAENKLDESRIPHHFNVPSAFDCVIDMCGVFDRVSGIDFKDQIHLRVRGGGTSQFDNIGLSVQSAIDYCDQNDCEIDGAQICKGNDILYWVYFANGSPIHFSSKKPDRLDDFKSYSKEEFRRDIQQIAEDIKAY